MKLNELCLDNENLVKSIARTFYKKCRFNKIFDFDDFINMGYIGLLEAASRFDGRQNVKFSTFATPRIKGSIIDQTRNFLKTKEAAKNGITIVNMDDVEIESMVIQTTEIRNQIQKKQLLKIVEIIIEGLPEREKEVINFIYRKNLTTTQIAYKLGISMSRVSQIKYRAIARIRNKMKEFGE
jgi:RNA polymerase sigma factor for flagellar operon FliA